MKIKEIVKNINCSIVHIDEKTEIDNVTCDSREANEKSLFFCIKGFKTDGHNFIKDVLQKGCKSFCISENIEFENGINVIKTNDSRKAYAEASIAFYDHPAEKMRMIGVTGTNGKTTSTFMISHILNSLQNPTGLMGTLYTKFADKQITSSVTTPDAKTLQHNLSEMVKAGIKNAVFEVSSHALSLDRVHGIKFDVAVFTNLTRDHLDFHKNFDEYFEAKLKLFQNLKKETGIAIINTDDEYGIKIPNLIDSKCITYGIKSGDIRAFDPKVGQKGISYTLISGNKKIQVNLQISGFFNVYNSLASICACKALGISEEESCKALESFTGVKGRFELVKTKKDFVAIVDYAHTPDGLENVLKTAKAISHNKVIAVFGCGGDRDKTKRPIMGKIASDLSDITIITSDNPRTENPDLIIEDIEKGVPEGKKYHKEVDREKAIKLATEMATSGDVIVVAGKGHENYQIFKDKTIHFDDTEVLNKYLMG